MDLKSIYKQKHELWLKILFSSFAIKDSETKRTLYEFSTIEFRHLKWLSNHLKEQDIEYDYERSSIEIQKSTNFEYFSFLISEVKSCQNSYEKDEEIFKRFISDEHYMINVLEQYLNNKSNDAQITAFDKAREYKSLDDQSKDALTLFLFEESYKEYELIMLYSYFQNYTTDILQYNIYQDMIDESQYHLKSFGQMMSQMGILSIPRIVIEPLYKNKNIKQFLTDGIQEEENAKAECLKLAQMIQDEEISEFLTFVMLQENYHIELMQKAIKKLS